MDTSLLLPPKNLSLHAQTLWRRGAVRIAQLARTDALHSAHMYVRQRHHSWLLEATFEQGRFTIGRDQNQLRDEGRSEVFILTLLLTSPLAWATILKLLEDFPDASVELDRLIVQGNVCRSVREDLPITVDIIHGQS